MTLRQQNVVAPDVEGGHLLRPSHYSRVTRNERPFQIASPLPGSPLHKKQVGLVARLCQLVHIVLVPETAHDGGGAPRHATTVVHPCSGLLTSSLTAHQLPMEAHEEVQKWVTELERGKAWLEGQRANWERTAEEREKTIQEQQAWMGELEQGKAWLEEQYASWRRVAEESEQEQSRSCTLLWRARI